MGEEEKKKIIRNRKLYVLVALLLILLLSIVIVPSMLIRTYHAYSYDNPFNASENLTNQPRVALVLGGGISNDGQPRPVLQERLDAAISLYENGLVDRFLVSGDNRVPTYNEPKAMRDYLQARGIPVGVIIEDFAGRSTYESCERAIKIFEIEQVLIVTQVGHLDRAIFLCRSFGIDAYGYAAQYPLDKTPIGQLWREVLSNLKAVFNVYVIGERTVLGDKQPIQ